MMEGLLFKRAEMETETNATLDNRYIYHFAFPKMKSLLRQSLIVNNYKMTIRIILGFYFFLWMH